MSIYDQIGGAPAVQTAVDRFYTKVIGDPQLAGYFHEIDLDRLKRHQRAFISAALGGPDSYQGRDMNEAHSSLAISDADFDAVVEHLVVTLQELDVPDTTIGQIGDALAPLRTEIVSRTAIE
ncbi:MAG: group 1 truncated hemoglobin [Acidimicrobiaceae bacterium]|nr:group 1 truncated hemoglobin [Acidimicrobiaceae bacterium]